MTTMTIVGSDDTKTDCKFPKHLDGIKKKGEEQIDDLKGKRFKVSDAEDDGYTYEIGICTDAVVSAGYDGVGVLQKKKNSENDPVVIGKYVDADIMAGPEWVRLEYNSGKEYHTHCAGDKGRRAVIMFICDPNKLDDEAVILEEQSNKNFSCYYLFEIGTKAVCPETPFITIGLSVGSILLIVFFSLAAVYLIGGILYNRFVRGAKGVDQIPNYRFWEDCGNLQADGCDLVCRSRKSREPKTYKGIGDDLIQEDEERTHDEHLLPM